jgi:hypothetical protein
MHYSRGNFQIPHYNVYHRLVCIRSFDSSNALDDSTMITYLYHDESAIACHLSAVSAMAVVIAMRESRRMSSEMEWPRPA